MVSLFPQLNSKIDSRENKNRKKQKNVSISSSPSLHLCERMQLHVISESEPFLSLHINALGKS